jgi:hypothetical protein
MRWLDQYIEGGSRTYSGNFVLTVVVGSSVWLGLAIGQTALALHRHDAFSLVLGFANVLISASTVSLDVLVLRRILRQLPPALRHD